MKFFRSLLAKYLMIILTALFLIQVTFLLLMLFAPSIEKMMGYSNSLKEREDPNKIEEKWHREAKNMQNVTEKVIGLHFSKWKHRYPESSMFWVDGNEVLAEQLDVKEKLPSKWTATFTAKFMKDHYNGDPFTVVAFVGKDKTSGFIVVEIPRKTFNPPVGKLYDKYGDVLWLGIIFIIFIFITVSLLFFRGIRKRLVQLQDAMEIRDVDGLPIQIDVKKKDEIGQLEQTFNQMVYELRESKQREEKEEQLRRELIANLSHDLRTPLTKIRAQTYSIAKEDLSHEGEQAIKALEASIVNIDRLIENLMSYTLLMASKYKLELKEVDVIRFVRELLASWYPVFEKEGFEIDVELHSFENKNWVIDPIWFGRILDNLFQNVLRHAKSGKYIGVRTEIETTDQYDAFVISDRGAGMENNSDEKGAGIGLSIVDMMVKGMGLDWNMESSAKGTTIKIKKYK